jgi:glycosyltransferase involved in cell wall biosynthesis
MKLSIITCTYNSEKYLQECIDSVVAQNLDIHEYEHIFVDAYSTDKTKKIIVEYKKKYSNVRLIEREPK